MKLFSIKHIKECSGGIVVLILILGILGVFSIHRESFLSGGLFPEATTKALMSPPFGKRPMKKNRKMCTWIIKEYIPHTMEIISPYSLGFLCTSYKQ